MSLSLSPERLIAAGASVLAVSVFADSAVEHYRGSFHNPAMFAPLAISAVATGVNGAQAVGGKGARPPHLAAVATGVVGLGFHAYDIASRTGGWRLVNLFYAAPVGAPAALVLAGSLGVVAEALAKGNDRVGGVSIASGRALGGIVAAGLAGSAGEAALLHFRGAYHNPAMWLPVTLPPLAAISLAVDVATARASARSALLLTATALLGLIGAGFHVYGVARHMGGWRNWRQTLLAGPPIPAPPSFTGLALAGMGTLKLLRRRANG